MPVLNRDYSDGANVWLSPKADRESNACVGIHNFARRNSGAFHLDRRLSRVLAVEKKDRGRRGMKTLFPKRGKQMWGDPESPLFAAARKRGANP
jgi:hypothetical protein